MNVVINALDLHYLCQTCGIFLSGNQPLHLSIPASETKIMDLVPKKIVLTKSMVNIKHIKMASWAMIADNYQLVAHKPLQEQL